MTRKVAIGRAFDAAADRYDAHAGLQRDVAHALAQRIGRLALPPRPSVLEIGCGTGALTGRLRHLLPGACILATDLSPRMASACRDSGGGPVLVMDGEWPAFREASFDLICASLAFQWFDDLPAALLQLRPLLRPAGKIVFATLGPGSLSAWRRSLGHATPAAYPGPAAIAGAWPGTTVIERRDVTVRHASGLAFLHGLHAIGAGTPAPGQDRISPTELRAALRRFETAYDATVEYEILDVELS